MGSRVQAFAILLIGVLTASAAWAVGPAPIHASSMCPPVTMSDLTSTTTTTTVAPDPTTTTAPPETTTTTVAPEPPDTAPQEPADDGETAPEPSIPPEEPTPDETPTTSTSPPETPTTTAPPRPTTTTPACDSDFVYPMVFPILGAGGIGSPFGAPRDGGRRLHAGNDIFADHLQPVVAISDGVVSRIGPDEGISGYYIRLKHDDGWQSLYIHLNNDTAGTDDGNGIGIRSDLAEGDRVVAGQVIGWVGDSGNAENTTHHLHFELRTPGGESVDPEASLRAATRFVAPGTPDGVTSFDGSFADHTGTEVTPFTLLLSRGAPVWCDDLGALACPDEPATADDIAAWLVPLVGEVSLIPAAPEPDGDRPADCGPRESCSDAPIESVCEEDDECASPQISAAELFRALAWDRLRDSHERQSLLGSAGTERVPAPPPLPSDLSLEVAVAMAASNVCETPVDLTAPMTRSEVAAWLVVHLGWESADQCDLPVLAHSAIR